MISTICPNTKTGYSVSYGFLLLAIVMELFFTSPMLIKYIHQHSEAFYHKLVLFLFGIYPAFHYSKIYNDIAESSTKHFSLTSGIWEEGVGYSYADLFKTRSEKFNAIDSYYIMPTTFESLIYLNLTSCFFLLLTWYADHVIANVKQNYNKLSSLSELMGTTNSFFFFFLFNINL